FRHNIWAEMGGKTGTTQNYSDGWFMGFTPQLVGGAWVGCEDRSAHFRSFEYGQGARLALPIWGKFLEKVYADKSLNIVQEAKFEKPEEPVSVELDCSKYKEKKPDEHGFGSEYEDYPNLP
ncbi:MAG: penicillin-binding protein, partial [Bacteroidetes bacterium]|nr:penicillin-binding protein [Bacteroidota bacterium]